jgi:hypothetical protein
MGFSLQEAQWLVKFYRGLPGQTVQSAQSQPVDEQAMMMQAQQVYEDYPAEEYYDEYWAGQ